MPIDHRAIAELAARQHGAISHAQALAAGVTRTGLATATSSGRWVRAARGVYVLASHRDTPAQRAMAASLARPDGVVGDLTVALLRGWVRSAPPLPWLLVPPGTSARLPIAQVRRSIVQADERTRIDGIPVTTAARTLVDLAHHLGPSRLTTVVDAVMHEGGNPSSVRVQLDRTPRLSRARASALLAALEPWDGPIVPGSGAEARLFRLIVGWGFPKPERQVPIIDERGQTVARADGGWPAERIGFEYDSPGFHGPERWAADESRHAEVERLGWRLLHADKADLRAGERSFRDALARAWADRRP